MKSWPHKRGGGDGAGGKVFQEEEQHPKTQSSRGQQKSGKF